MFLRILRITLGAFFATDSFAWHGNGANWGVCDLLEQDFHTTVPMVGNYGETEYSFPKGEITDLVRGLADHHCYGWREVVN